MWFTNLTLYRLLEPFGESPEWLAEQLAAKSERPCGPLEAFSFGFSPPLGRLAEHYVHAANGAILLRACKQTRMLPAAVVREELDERIAQIEASQARTVRGKERRQMKDEIVFELLPRAFTRNVYTAAFILPASGWLVIDSSSPTRAEDFVTLLREAAPSIKLERYVSNTPPMLMGKWLERGHAPEPFSLSDECELREPGEEGAIVRCQRENLGSDEVRAHLRAGKEVQRLGLEYQANLRFVLGVDLGLRRLRFQAVDELDSNDELDEAARFDANFAYMIAELTPLLGEIGRLFGVDEPVTQPEEQPA